MSDADIEREIVTAAALREAERRGRVCTAIEVAWAGQPHLRLGELIAAASWLASRDRDPGRVADDVLAAAAFQYAVEQVSAELPTVLEVQDAINHDYLSGGGS